MAKSNLYTRTGDSGTTSLVGGTRIAKDSPRLEAYGTLDEFSSFLGCVLSDPACPQEVKSQLLEIQNMLFNLGSYLATQVQEGEKPAAWGITPDDTQRLEGWIDTLDAQTPRIKAFVLPGGCMLAAKAHVARTVCRRAERRITTLSTIEYVDPALTAYINRFQTISSFWPDISTIQREWKKSCGTNDSQKPPAIK